jgi:hypothetical protein
MFTNSATSLIGKKPATRAVSPPMLEPRMVAAKTHGPGALGAAGRVRRGADDAFIAGGPSETDHWLPGCSPF